MTSPNDNLIVFPTAKSRGILRYSGQDYPCALGHGGVSTKKREGDGTTPAGVFTLRQVLFRADRVAAPLSALSVSALSRSDGWCDDPEHAAYNQHVQVPFAASHETLWRDDSLYDVIVVIGHNDDPPRPGMGSAIFLHCASEDYAATEGCVAISCDDLLVLLPDLSTAIKLDIKESD